MILVWKLWAYPVRNAKDSDNKDSKIMDSRKIYMLKLTEVDCVGEIKERSTNHYASECFLVEGTDVGNMGG